MANSVFATFLQALGAGQIVLDAGEFRVALIDTDVYTPNLTDAGHDFVVDITNNGVLSEAILQNVSWNNRVFDADDFQNNFPDHGGGATGEALLIYKHVAAAALPIIGIDAGNNQLVVDGDHSANLSKGKLIKVTDATDVPNGNYSISAVAVDATPETTITVYEDIAGATADGNIETSDEALSRLMFWMDSVTGLPVIMDGNDDSIIFNANGIWRLNV